MTSIKYSPFISADAIEKNPLEIEKDKGGILCKTEDDGSFLKVITAFSKKIAGKLIKGKFNFSSMQRPTMLSMPESHLQMLSHEFSLALEYFEVAATVQDELERLKIIIAGVIGNLSSNVFRAKGKGPLNPTLGETFSVI